MAFVRAFDSIRINCKVSSLITTIIKAFFEKPGDEYLFLLSFDSSCFQERLGLGEARLGGEGHFKKGLKIES